MEPGEASPSPPPSTEQGVWPPPPVNQPVPEVLQLVPDFRKQNVLLLILLYVGTLGIYTIFWLRRQILTVNAIAGQKVIPPAAVWVAVGLYAMTFGYGVVEGMMTLSSDSKLLIRLVYNVGMWIIFFMVRDGLNRAMGLREGDRGYVGKAGTFFFSLFYMQHKINVYLKNQRGL